MESIVASLDAWFNLYDHSGLVLRELHHHRGPKFLFCKIPTDPKTLEILDRPFYCFESLVGACYVISPLHIPRLGLLSQISEHIYEIRNQGPELLSAEIVFFHGLELESSSEPHISSWLPKNKTELWLNWLQKEFPKVRILLTVRYADSLLETNEKGRFDSYQACENLLGELIGRRGSVGAAICPVVLLGHCLGGLVLKAFLVMAAHKSSFEKSLKGSLSNVKGIFCYTSPHHGSE